MSTSVVLRVTPAEPIEPDRWAGEVPQDIVAVLRAAGQPDRAGLVQRGSGLVRLRFQLSGLDRVEAGQRLEEQLRHLGYEADLSFSP